MPIHNSARRPSLMPSFMKWYDSFWATRVTWHWRAEAPRLGMFSKSVFPWKTAMLISHQDAQNPSQESHAAGQAGANSTETQPTLFLVTGFVISSGVGFDFKLQGNLFKC